MDSWKKFLKALGSVIGTVLVLIATYFSSWAVAAVVLWVIFKLLEITYTIKIATAIWLVMLLVRNYIVNDKK